MKNIKRYEPSQHRFADVGMVEQENGKWVSYDDYVALNNEVQRSHDQYNGIIDTQLAEMERIRFVAEDNKQEAETTRLQNAHLKIEVDSLSKWRSGAERLLNNYVQLMFGKDERHYKVEKELEAIKKELNDLKKNG